MTDAREIYSAINEIAPFASAESWDNVGILVDCGNKTDRVLLALDATAEVVEEAIRLACGIIVTHHPVIFSPLKRLSPDMPSFKAVQNGISIISAHTNFDIAPLGVNTNLADIVGLKNYRLRAGGFGCIGELHAENGTALADAVASKFGLETIVFADAGREINTVAVFSGSGADLENLAAEGCDAVVTGDLKHHDALDALQLGLTVVAAGHYETEAPAMQLLCGYLESRIPTAEFVVSETSHSPIGHIRVK